MEERTEMVALILSVSMITKWQQSVDRENDPTGDALDAAGGSRPSNR